MSASTEKKLRQAAREAGTDKKTLALEKEAKEKAKSKRRWTLGTIAVLVLILLVVLVNSPLIYNSTAYSVGSRDFSAAEVSYHYANQYSSFVNQYGSYASMFGLDTANGISGLDKQDCPLAEGSWKDYFLDAAKNGMLQTTALTDYAAANGIALDESEKAEILSAFDGLKETAKLYGYGSADKMLAANYGAGVTQKLVQNAYLESALANKVVTEVSEGFTTRLRSSRRSIRAMRARRTASTTATSMSPPRRSIPTVRTASSPQPPPRRPGPPRRRLPRRSPSPTGRSAPRRRRFPSG